MSLMSCDHKISLSPRRDVSKKRLRQRATRTAGSAATIVVGNKIGIILMYCVLAQLDLIVNPAGALLADPTTFEGIANSNGDTGSSSSSSILDGGSNLGGSNSGSSSIGGSGSHYLDKLDKLERSVAAVLIKVAYGTTSTTKRSIPDNSYVPSLTTIATPPLTTLRYLEKTQHQQQINLHHRNYELDLERDHALPTSAPNADILKSNSNPTYPNPNRHHNHDRDRHRHLLNSTPAPSSK